MRTGRGVFLLYLAFSAAVFGYSVLSPIYNWDLLGYVACVGSIRSADANAVHRYAYDEVRKAVPAATLKVLDPPDGAGYNGVLSSDPEAFAEALPFYRTRVLYVALVYGLSRLGMNVIMATHFVSAVSVMVSTWLLFLMVRRRVPQPFLLALPLLALSFGWLDVSRLSTPDGLSMLGILACAALYLRSSRWMLVALPMLTLIRGDLIVFSVPFACLLLILRRFPRSLVLGSLASSIGCYWLIDIWSGHPGWATVFYHTLVSRLVHPLSQPVQLTPSEYLRVVGRGLRSVVSSPSMLTFGAIVTAVAARMSDTRLPSDQTRLVRDEAVLATVAVVYVVLHFAVFPVTWERFYVGPYLLGAVALGSLMAGKPSGSFATRF